MSGMAETDRFRVNFDQTLHGYADGHQLLAASCSLETEERAQLLIMSDLSGPSGSKGFDSYLTGYPLSPTRYVLAMTWLAREMPRPGCVWTHSLLIRVGDLGRLGPLWMLAGLFRRPESTNVERYESRMVFDIEKDLWPSPPLSDEFVRIGDALYRFPDRCVIVPTTESERYAQPVLALWSAQWPRLRRSFQFCTGVLGVEELAVRGFDLEVAPRHVVSHVHLSVERAVVLTGEQSPDPAWLAACSQIAAGNSLREFLWEFGPDFSNGREAFLKLVRVWHLLTEQRKRLGSATWTERASELARFYEHVDEMLANSPEARRLRLALYGFSDSKYRVTETDAVMLLAIALSAVKVEVELAPLSAHIRKELERAESTGTSEVIDRISSLETPNSGALLKAIADAIRREHVGRLSERALLGCVRSRRELLTWPEVWRELGQRRELLIRLAREDTLTGTPSVLRAALSVGASGSFELWRELLGSEGVQAIIDATFDLDAQVDTTWVAALRERRGEVVAALAKGALSPSAAWLAGAVLCGIRDRPQLDWFGGDWSTKHIRLELSDELRAGSVLLSIALRLRAQAAGPAVVSAFPVVYYGAAAGRLWGSAWQELEDELPPIWQWWDKCERLIQAVSRYFADCRMPTRVVFATFADPIVFDRAVRYLAWNADSTQLVEQLYAAAASEASSAQREVLRGLR